MHVISWCIDHQLDIWECREFNQLYDDAIAACSHQILANNQNEMQKHVMKVLINMLFKES
eukprot:10613269-Ditylum_brightwellii.AAC.1